MKEHPLVKFWREDSGWGNSPVKVEVASTPELGLSEGQLCIETWNAAIKEVVDIIIHEKRVGCDVGTYRLRYVLDKIYDLEYEE